MEAEAANCHILSDVKNCRDDLVVCPTTKETLCGNGFSALSAEANHFIPDDARVGRCDKAWHGDRYERERG